MRTSVILKRMLTDANDAKCGYEHNKTEFVVGWSELQRNTHGKL